jgi:4-amino-4-deoxy-L-arabinose transferase-like glycosyltransferase
MLGRLTSVVMGIGTLIVIAAITERYYGRRAAQWAVICCLAFLPFAFYAKLANLDLPYVFWFVVALWCWIKLEADPRPRWYGALGIAAALSIATKDQAYALFVLPGIVIAVRALSRYGLRGLRLVLVAGAASAVAFALAHNLPLNPSGFAAHIDQLTGLQSNANFRMFPATLAGLWALSKVTMSLITWNIGVPGLLLTLIGLTAATQVRPHPRWLLLLPMVSYLVLFVGLAGYQYDRFLLPLCVVLPILAGAGADRLVAWPGSRRAQTAIAVLVAAALLWRPAVIDVMMIRDARVAADAWLEAAVQPHHTVGSFGRDLYLPRLDGFERVPLNGFIDDTLARRPTFIVLNAEYNRRYLSHATHAAWMQWLQSGASPYAEVFRYKAPVPAPAVGLFALMRDRDENPFSNLDKINPEILILQLRESVQQPHLR